MGREGFDVMALEDLLELFRSEARKRGAALNLHRPRDANAAFDVIRRVTEALISRGAFDDLARFLADSDAGVRLAAAAKLFETHPEARRVLIDLSTQRNMVGMSADAELFAQEMRARFKQE